MHCTKLYDLLCIVQCTSSFAAAQASVDAMEGVGSVALSCTSSFAAAKTVTDGTAAVYKAALIDVQVYGHYTAAVGTAVTVAVQALLLL